MNLDFGNYFQFHRLLPIIYIKGKNIAGLRGGWVDGMGVQAGRQTGRQVPTVPFGER